MFLAACTTPGLLTDAPLGLEKAMTSDLPLPLLCLLKTLQLGGPLPRNSSAILMWQIALENSVPSPSAFRLTQSAYSILGPQQQGLSFASPTLQQTLKPCLAFSCLAWAQLQWEWMTQLSMMKWKTREPSKSSKRDELSLCPSIAWRLPGERERESERQRDRKHQRPRVA